MNKNGIQLYIKREDLIHPEISGNKWRKLKYNIQKAVELSCQRVITFGGAYSNHIAATAAAGRLNNIKTLGVIRGEETLPLNPTLQLAKDNGMDFIYVSRVDYRGKESVDFLSNHSIDSSESYIIPEGGANDLGLKGCQEIIENCDEFDLFVCACGTANTFSGIVSKMKPHQSAIGIPVLKNADFLNSEVQSNLDRLNENKEQWKLNLNYHFGGYAKNNTDLVSFIQEFWIDHQVKLDPIYTGKAMYGLIDLLKTQEIQARKILFIHTGGLQGVAGFEKRYKLNLFKGSND